MTTVTRTPSPWMQFFDANGNPLAGGKLYTYASGTATPHATYTDVSASTPNLNPIILNTRGEAQIWLDSTLYSFTLTDSANVQIWTADAIGGSVDTSVYTAFVAALAATGGSDLIGYSSTMTVQDKLQQYLSVKDYGATGDGTTNDTAAVNAGIVAATAAGRTLYFPAGTYLVSQITAISKMKLVGESSVTTIIKSKGGSNIDLVTSPTTLIDDVWIQGICFDGNSAGNSLGNTLVITGAKPNLIDVVVLNSAENGIITDWAGPSFRATGSEGYFSHITIDTPQKSGWLHSGPSDSLFDTIIIIDAGAKTDAAYYGFMCVPTSLGGTGSNGRFNNLHHWNRSSTTNTALSGVYVGFGGNTFTNCHFEGGHTCLNVPGDANVFEACDYYAPRGTYAITMAGGTNKLSGIVGATYFSGNRNYTGLNLVGADNMINLVVMDQVTAVRFGDASTGGNFVTVAGYLSTPGALYTGAYANNDVLSMVVQGTGGGTLNQSIGSAWTAYTPTVTAGTGTLTSASATGRYSRVGNTVSIQQTITVTTNGSGATYISASLPVQAATHEYLLTGRNDTTGKMLQAEIMSGATSTRTFDYANAYPVASGQILYISGTYEAL